MAAVAAEFLKICLVAAVNAVPPAPSRGSDLRYDMELTFEKAVHGCEKEIRLSKLDSCDSCKGSGVAEGGRRSTCGTCNGRGQVVQSQGFFSVAQTCPKCQGSGASIDKPCLKCNGEGRRDKSSKVTIRVPAGVDTGARLRSTGNGEARSAWTRAPIWRAGPPIRFNARRARTTLLPPQLRSL